MKNKGYIVGVIILLLILNVFLIFKKDNNIVEKNKVIKIERKEFNIYLQQSVGSEDYNPSSSESFPSQGYLLNTTKTVCYDYNGKETSYKPTQNLVNEIIDGSITIESNKTTYCNLYFDKNEKPTITTFNVKGKTSSNQELNNGFTYQTDSLPFNIEYTDTEEDVKQYCINETEGSDNCNWQTLSGTKGTYTLIDKTDGLKTMYIYLKDKANNISGVSQYTITVDKTKPVINTFTLTGTSDENQTLSNSAQYTHKPNITYNASINETNIESYCVYENSGCNYEETIEKELTKKEYNLTESEGIKTLSIKVKDKAGNESVVDINSTKTITLDLQNPTSTIEEKSKTTNSITVTVSGEDKTPNSSIIEQQCRLNGTDNWTNAEEDGSCTIDKLSDGQELKDGQEYTIEGRVRDASGRYSTNNPSIEVTTQFEYTCNNIGGDLAFDEQKGWICKSNGKSSLVTYWTCSVEPSVKYESEIAAKSACSKETKGTCTNSYKNVCDDSYYLDTFGRCYRYFSCSPTDRELKYAQCSFDNKIYDYDTCSLMCIDRKSPVEVQQVSKCSLNKVEYSDQDSCESACVKTEELGSIGSYDEEVYSCDSGWSELSNSGTSNLVCYKEAERKQ